MMRSSSKQDWLLRFTWLVAAFLASEGCGPSPVTQTQEVALPDSFEIEGTTWTRQSWSDKHDHSLGTYFKKHVHLAENPAFQGTRVCYTNDLGTHRCYWVTAVGDSSRWIALEFNGSKFQPVMEGQGVPFDKLQPKGKQ